LSENISAEIKTSKIDSSCHKRGRSRVGREGPDVAVNSGPVAAGAQADAGPKRLETEGDRGSASVPQSQTSNGLVFLNCLEMAFCKKTRGCFKKHLIVFSGVVPASRVKGREIESRHDLGWCLLK
jgi:hypothetical protein